MNRKLLDHKDDPRLVQPEHELAPPAARGARVKAADLKPVRIGYLPFYVDYYEGICPDFPREKAAVAGRCADTLRSLGDVVWDGQLIRDADSAARVGRELREQSLDCIVVVSTIAVFGGIPWAALRQLDLPILIWNAQQIRTVGKGYSMVEIVRHTGQIGTQALANTLLREGRWFRVVTGHESSPRSAKQLARFLRVARTASRVRAARLIAVGEGFPMMTDVELDPAYLREHLGPTIARVSAHKLTHSYVSVREEEVDRHLVQLKRKAVVHDIEPDELRRSVRLCEAVATLADANQAAAGTVNCHGPNCLRNPAIGITACYSLGYQNSLGRPFTCTGDLPTALAMLLLKELTGASMYTEVQVMDEKRNAVVIANSGEGEDAIRRPGAKPSVRGNTNFKGLHGRGASFAYPLKPGPATIVSLTPTPHGLKKFRLVVAEGQILPDRLPDAGALAGFFRFASANVHHAYTRWLEAGPVHHAGTAPGHWASELADVAQLLDIEFVGV